MKQLLISISIWFFTIPLLLIFRKRERLMRDTCNRWYPFGFSLVHQFISKIFLSNLVETITFKWSFIIEAATLKIDPLAAFF
jgi:1-acyl-sn-glycerol-3-phosphate acyltransferase